MSVPTESTPPPHVPVPPHAPVHVPLPPPPPGTAFALGWLMAGLFDDRRRRILDVRQPPFSQAVQLPLVADLDEPDLLKFLVTDLHDLLRPYHDISDARVQAEAAKRQPGSAEPFDKAVFEQEVNALHLAILDRLADELGQWNLQLRSRNSHFIRQWLRERNLILNTHTISIHIDGSLLK